MKTKNKDIETKGNNNIYPAVLVSTIPSWSRRSGANTFSILFEGYPSEKLANIYVRADLPDSTVAGRYFRILEGNVMKSVFSPFITTGTEVSISPNKEEEIEYVKELKKYNYFSRHRLGIFLILREIGWLLGRWKSKELNTFLRDFNPEVFVFHIESYPYFNRLNNYLIRKIKPRKVIAYLWDDNFSYKQYPSSRKAKISRFFLRKQVKRLVKKSDTILAISPKMKEECDREFGINSVLMTKPMLNENAIPYQQNISKPIRIVYSGSLILGRDKAITLLVECLKEINKSETKIVLDIYSGTPLSETRKALINAEGTSCLRGHIPQDEVFKQQEEADILLFVENINNRNYNPARLSFSTKITDYLSRRRTILAIGPKDIAPMEYLNNEDAALVCSNKDEILSTLHKIVEDQTILKIMSEKAFECAQRNHSRDRILKKFQDIIIS